MLLTKADRARIIHWVKQNAFKEDHAALKKQEEVFAEELRVAWNGGAKTCAVIDKLPEGVAYTPWGFWADNVGHINTNGKRIAHQAQAGFAASDWKARKTDLANAEAELKKRVDALCEEVRTSLLAARTVKRAIEMFPEFEAMLPTESSALLPAVQIEALRFSLCDAGVIKCEEEPS